jgi:hypothetical protein
MQLEVAIPQVRAVGQQLYAERLKELMEDVHTERHALHHDFSSFLLNFEMRVLTSKSSSQSAAMDSLRRFANRNAVSISEEEIDRVKSEIDTGFLRLESGLLKLSFMLDVATRNYERLEPYRTFRSLTKSLWGWYGGDDAILQLTGDDFTYAARLVPELHFILSNLFSNAKKHGRQDAPPYCNVISTPAEFDVNVRSFGNPMPPAWIEFLQGKVDVPPPKPNGLRGGLSTVRSYLERLKLDLPRVRIDKQDTVIHLRIPKVECLRKGDYE